MTKAPAAGRSKTRLVPPLAPDDAARLAEAMLLDTLEACAAEADEVGLLCPDSDQAAALRALVGDGTAIHVQRGRGLGDALREEMLTATPDAPLALVSSDIPGPPPGEIARAFGALRDGADLALGPSLDGGYWLIAMRRFHEAPFVGIPWSTPACAAVTLGRCEAAGLRAAVVREWLDIDTLVDLSLAVHAPPGPAGPRTAAVLTRLAASVEVPAPPALRLISSELIAASPYRSVLRDRLAAARGDARRDYLYVAAPRAVFVVPVTAGGDVLLVRQYRHPVRDWTIEVPAGSVAAGEAPLDAARRELAEEVGGRGGTWTHLASFFSSSAHLDLRSDAFLATGVEVGGAAPGEDEEIAIVRMPAAEAIASARAGRMVEGQTALCLLLAASRMDG